MKTGRFPKSYKLGPRTTAWLAEDIQELIRQFSENVQAEKQNAQKQAFPKI